MENSNQNTFRTIACSLLLLTSYHFAQAIQLAPKPVFTPQQVDAGIVSYLTDNATYSGATGVGAPCTVKIEKTPKGHLITFIDDGNEYYKPTSIKYVSLNAAKNTKAYNIAEYSHTTTANSPYYDIHIKRTLEESLPVIKPVQSTDAENDDSIPVLQPPPEKRTEEWTLSIGFYHGVLYSASAGFDKRQSYNHNSGYITCGQFKPLSAIYQP